MSIWESSYTVKTDEAYNDLSQLNDHVAMTARTIDTTVKTGYQTIYLLMDILGQTMPLALNLAAQGLFAISAGYTIVANMEALNPMTIIQAGLHFAMATLLFYRALQIQSKATEIEDKLQKGMQITRMYT